MLYLHKSFIQVASYTHCRRVSILILRIEHLQVLQFVHQVVKFLIRYFGRIQHIVIMVMAMQFSTQKFYSFFRIHIYLRYIFKFHTLFTSQLQYNLLIRMVYKLLYQAIRHITIQCYLIPILLIKMPCAFYCSVLFAKFQRICGITFQNKFVSSSQIDNSKHFSHHFYNQRLFIKGKTLCHSLFCEAIFSYFFDIHTKQTYL